MKRNHKLFVKDILDCIEKINEFIGDMDFDKFMQDDKTKSAVVRKLEIIGEATKNIPRQIREKYRELPWTDMAGLRDKIAHFYFGIDYEIVWEVVKKRLPEIKPIIHKVLKEMEE
ncbi:MAG: DUF86 domain-containing protein [Deltaproteobacteria bacterium]|nr:DUF86 domain-containing protein [Deltaproteobacteria bacterium]